MTIENIEHVAYLNREGAKRINEQMKDLLSLNEQAVKMARLLAEKVEVIDRPAQDAVAKEALFDPWEAIDVMSPQDEYQEMLGSLPITDIEAEISPEIRSGAALARFINRVIWMLENDDYKFTLDGKSRK